MNRKDMKELATRVKIMDEAIEECEGLLNQVEGYICEVNEEIDKLKCLIKANQYMIDMFGGNNRDIKEIKRQNKNYENGIERLRECIATAIERGEAIQVRRDMNKKMLEFYEHTFNTSKEEFLKYL